MVHNLITHNCHLLLHPHQAKPRAQTYPNLKYAHPSQFQLLSRIKRLPELQIHEISRPNRIGLIVGSSDSHISRQLPPLPGPNDPSNRCALESNPRSIGRHKSVDSRSSTRALADWIDSVQSMRNPLPILLGRSSYARSPRTCEPSRRSKSRAQELVYLDRRCLPSPPGHRTFGEVSISPCQTVRPAL